VTLHWATASGGARPGAYREFRAQFPSGFAKYLRPDSAAEERGVRARRLHNEDTQCPKTAISMTVASRCGRLLRLQLPGARPGLTRPRFTEHFDRSIPGLISAARLSYNEPSGSRSDGFPVPPSRIFDTNIRPALAVSCRIVLYGWGTEATQSACRRSHH